jgi:hypothetical protein
MCLEEINLLFCNFKIGSLLFTPVINKVVRYNVYIQRIPILIANLR